MRLNRHLALLCWPGHESPSPLGHRHCAGRFAAASSRDKRRLSSHDGHRRWSGRIHPLRASLVWSHHVGRRPQYFQTANVTSDGAETFAFFYETNPWQPSQQGGENVFAWAYVTLSWSLSAQVVLTPIVDGQSAAVVLADGSSLVNISSSFQLGQQGGTLQRISEVFPVPLVRRQMRSGAEVARWYLRGERLQIAIETTGPLGVGELMLEGIEVEYTPVRKAIYAPVSST
jgi:hypothetical protein